MPLECKVLEEVGAGSKEPIAEELEGMADALEPQAGKLMLRVELGLGVTCKGENVTLGCREKSRAISLREHLKGNSRRNVVSGKELCHHLCQPIQKIQSTHVP